MMNSVFLKAYYFFQMLSNLSFRVRHKLFYSNRIIFGSGFKFGGRLKITLDENGSKLIFGKNVSFRNFGNILIHNGGTVNIGDNVFFNNGCSINCLDEIEIGSNTIFGEDVKLYDHNHKFDDRTKYIRDQGFTTKKIQIGSNCWISSNVVILKGVKIGDNSIIGANCLIFKDIEPNSVVKCKSELVKKLAQ